MQASLMQVRLWLKKNQEAGMLKQEPRTEDPRSKERIQRAKYQRKNTKRDKKKYKRFSETQRPFGFFSLEFFCSFFVFRFVFLLWFLASWFLVLFTGVIY